MKTLLKKTKGTVAHFSDESLEFTPYGKGEPVYESSYKVGESTIGVTTPKTTAGKKNFVAKLKCSADDPDPRETLHEQLDKLAQKMFPATLPPTKPRGKVLINRNGAYMAINSKTGILSIHLDIDLSETCDYGKTLANFLIESNQCLYINQALLRRVCRATAKPSKQ